MSVLSKDLGNRSADSGGYLDESGLSGRDDPVGANFGNAVPFRAENDSAGGVASREFGKLIYGADSPYARSAEYATIDSITREDLISFHGSFFYPNNMMLAVWGDFHTPDMIQKIEEVFAGWEKREVEASRPPKVNYEFQNTVNLIQRDDVNQTNIFMGHIGGLRNDPDYFCPRFSEPNSRLGLHQSSFQRSEIASGPGLFGVWLLFGQL